jgi:C4-dicarboxylate-specific signal transduction histidine kinase
VARKLAPHQTPLELHDTELQNSLNGHWYQLRERAIQWVDGRVVRMEIATDITDRVDMEELNNQQSERLQQTSRLITMGEMASSLAHELNQPLAAIANYNMGCVNRLQANDYRPEELLAAMQKASAQAERAGKIIRRVRDFVKKSEPNRNAVQIDEVIEEIIGFAEIEARKAGVRISVSVPADLPAAYADKIMIEQVVLNLVKNGIEAMYDTPRAERELAISARANGKDFIEVKVADRGHGVLVEQTEKLFTPFYTTKPEGMGMGLNICRSIIEFHHGRLWAIANPGGGTVFSFTLPVNPR